MNRSLLSIEGQLIAISDRYHSHITIPICVCTATKLEEHVMKHFAVMVRSIKRSCILFDVYIDVKLVLFNLDLALVEHVKFEIGINQKERFEVIPDLASHEDWTRTKIRKLQHYIITTTK